MREISSRGRLAATVFFFLASIGTAIAGEFELEPGLKVLDPIVHEQLTVFPVAAEKLDAAGEDYLTLAAGLERKEVKVLERDADGEVNQVTVRNRSKRPLLLLGGEIILGGKQDRVISSDTVLPPGATKTVSVFCVEHGRWNGRREFSRGGGFAEAKVKLRAKFERNQSKVWEEVAKKTANLGAQSGTGTYRTVAEGAKTEEAISGYRQAIERALEAHPLRARMVGLISAVNGKVLTIDVFVSPALFAQFQDRLLKAMFVTAVDREKVPNAAPPAAEVIREFVRGAEAAPEQEVDDSPAATTAVKDGRSSAKSSLRTKNAGGPGKEIFRSYQAKE